MHHLHLWCHLFKEPFSPPCCRFGASLEAVDLGWGASRITDAAAAALARCPRLHSVGLEGETEWRLHGCVLLAAAGVILCCQAGMECKVTAL